MKILYVVNNPNFLASHRLNLIDNVKQQGYEVHIAGPQGAAVQRFKMMGCHYHLWPVSRKGVNPFKEWMTIRRLLKIYQLVEPNIAHHISLKPIIYGGLAARIAKIATTVNAVTGLGSTYISETLRAKVLQYIANIGFSIAGRHKKNIFIFQNRDDQQLFCEKKMVQRKQATIIPGAGICMQHYSLLPMPTQHHPKIVVLASRLLKDKGVLEFIEAAKILKRNTDIRFVLVGDIDENNRSSFTHQQIHAWVKSGVIEWWGFQADIRQVFAKCHLVCLPSYREGSPRVLIEAAACGRAIITTDVPGCRHLVRHEETGLLVAVKNAMMLAEGIEYLLSDLTRLTAMGCAGRLLVEHDYSDEKVVTSTLAVYTDLVTLSL